jgi:hypothetical protein
MNPAAAPNEAHAVDDSPVEAPQGRWPEHQISHPAILSRWEDPFLLIRAESGVVALTWQRFRCHGIATWAVRLQSHASLATFRTGWIGDLHTGFPTLVVTGNGHQSHP